MWKKLIRLALAMGLFALLSGCMAEPGEGFYALPQLPQDYLSLQNTINDVMGELGAEYASPSSGYNTQNVQLQDLDGDGERESAVAFFRVPSAEKPLKIYIFRQNQTNGEYEAAWIIEGEGTGIYSVSFENLGGTGEKEAVISWQISANAQSMTVFSLQRGASAVEMLRSGYTKASVLDIDRDNEKEVLLVQRDATENVSTVELYNYDNGLMVLKSTAPLSMNVTNVQNVKVGTLTDQAPALFVSSNFGEKGGRVTDVIAMRDDMLCNLTLQAEAGMSAATIRYTTDFKDVNGKDINNDGIFELPLPEYTRNVSISNSGSAVYVLNWFQFAPNGTAEKMMTTFHCYDDGWYLTAPEEWDGDIVATRRDSVGSTAGSERAVSFWRVSESVEGEEPVMEEFMTIYRLAGSNRTYRASIDDRVVIFETDDIIYAAKFRESEWNSNMDIDRLRELFNRIKVEWSAEN